MSVNSCALIKVNENVNKRVRRGGLLTKPANNMTVAEGFCESEDDDDDDEAFIDAEINCVKINIYKNQKMNQIDRGFLLLQQINCFKLCEKFLFYYFNL